MYGSLSQTPTDFVVYQHKSPKQRSFAVRLCTYSVFGCFLLLLYELIFLARTSANRDWDHLRRSKFTLQDVQRTIVTHTTPDDVKYVLGKDPESAFYEFGWSDIKSSDDSVCAQLKGVTNEKVVLGFNKTSNPASLALAQVLGRLATEGWEPYRDVLFCEVKQLEGWQSHYSSTFGKRSLAYLTGIQGNASFANPLLWHTLSHASESVLNPPPDPSWPRGDKSLEFMQYELGVPSMAIGAGSDAATAQTLGLVVSELTYHSVIPFRFEPYANLIYSVAQGNRAAKQARKLAKLAPDLDLEIDDIQDEYTKEYPWFDGWRKWLLLFRMKALNWRLFYLDRQFLGINGHVIFNKLPNGEPSIMPALHGSSKPEIRDLIRALRKVREYLSSDS